MKTPKIANIKTTMNNAFRVSMKAEVIGSRTVKISAWGSDQATCIRKLRRQFEKTANELIAEDKNNAKWIKLHKASKANAKLEREASIKAQREAKEMRMRRIAEQNANQIDPDEAYRRAKAMTNKPASKPVASVNIASSAKNYVVVDGVVEFV